MHVRHPFARLPRVIEVKHRGDRVDAQTVDVIFVQPEEAVRDEEIAHLVSAVIEDQRPPVAMFALARIGVFVKVGSVEQSEPVGILREMPRNPIDNDADPVLVATIDKVPKFIGVPESARRGEVAGHLIAPGTVEGMLGHRHQFDVGVTQVLHVRNQTIGELDIAQKPVTLFRNAGPRSEMNFVDADGLLVPLLRFTALNPFVIAPFESIEIEDQGSCLDPVLAIESERITFQNDLAKTVSHFEFVMGPFCDAWDKDFPDPGFDPFSHRMASAIPAVEITYDADALGVGTPNGKSCAGVPVDLGQMSAEFFVDIVVVALLEEVHVQLTENRTIGVRIANLEGLSGPGSDLQQVIECFRHSGERRFK